MKRSPKAFALALLLLASACIHRPTPNPNVLVVGVTNAPNNLDPRIGTDDVSAKAAPANFRERPIGDFTFLKDVARESPRDARRAGF